MDGNFTNATINIGGSQIHIQVDLKGLAQPWRIAPSDISSCPYPGLAVFGADDASYALDAMPISPGCSDIQIIRSSLSLARQA